METHQLLLGIKKGWNSCRWRCFLCHRRQQDWRETGDKLWQAFSRPHQDCCSITSWPWERRLYCIILYGVSSLHKTLRAERREERRVEKRERTCLSTAYLNPLSSLTENPVMLPMDSADTPTFSSKLKGMLLEQSMRSLHFTSLWKLFEQRGESDISWMRQTSYERELLWYNWSNSPLRCAELTSSLNKQSKKQKTFPTAENIFQWQFLYFRQRLIPGCLIGLHECTLSSADKSSGSCSESSALSGLSSFYVIPFCLSLKVRSSICRLAISKRAQEEEKHMCLLNCVFCILLTWTSPLTSWILPSLPTAIIRIRIPSFQCE